MSDLDEEQVHRRARRWLQATIVSGLLLVASIVVALGATIWKLEQTAELTTDTDLNAIMERSLFWIRLGLIAGCITFAAYIVSFVGYQRARSAKRSLQRAPQGRLRPFDPDSDSP